MLNRIQHTLKICGIANWRIREIKEETAELFFVRKQLDTRRIKDTCKYEVTVFCDTEKNGKPMRGATNVLLTASMNDETLTEKIKGAYFAAQFAANPHYDLPDAVTADPICKTGTLAEQPLMDSAYAMAKALYAPDTREDAFVNSAEVFVSRISRRILSSEGTDVFYTDANVNGEFVAQCKSPEDVEMHHTFSYDELNTEALSQKVAESLTFVCDRANAKRVLRSGNYDLVLSGNAVPTVLSYYVSRSSASMLYAKYSGWNVGDDVQKADGGEALDLTLCATVPYDAEGIPMQDLPLLENGKLLSVHGANRFCRYLGVKPTGSFAKVSCANGTVPFDTLKKEPCLWVVAFSDFQMDDFSGHFGGEIRLAYLIEGGKVTPVTGGSVNGSLLDAQGNMTFAAERYWTARYDGPYAVRFANISVAGE